MNMNILKGKLPCQICMIQCVEDELKEYYGGVGEFMCKKCRRRICPVHMNEPVGVCYECEKYNR